MEYSLESYREILKGAIASGFRFEPFRVDGAGAPSRLYLRHDVDFSLELALELARVNAELGARATFFVLSRSPVYNLRSHSSLASIREIQASNQLVALHATVPPGRLTEAELGRRLRADFDEVAREIPDLDPVFSWHNPTPEILEAWREKDTVEGLVNAYGVRFTKSIEYLSDSNRRHPADHFLACVTNSSKASLQLLLHPCNWVVGGASMNDTLEGLWRALMRTQEVGLLENRRYRELFPKGMPEHVVDAFVRAWAASTRGGSRS